MIDVTTVELCVSKDQPSPLVMVVPGPGDAVRDLVAEGLWVAPRNAAGPAALVVMQKVQKVYPSSLAFRPMRLGGVDVLVVDFISKLVTDVDEQRTYTFKRWWHARGVVE